MTIESIKEAAILYRHQDSQSPHIAAQNKSILILGYYGGTVENLMKKYGFLGPKYKMNVAAIVCPAFTIFSSKSMRKRTDKAMSWFEEQGLLNTFDTLVIASAGGTIVYYHCLRWAIKNTKLQPEIKHIVWENCPGTLDSSEYFRALKNTLKLKSMKSKVLLAGVVLPTFSLVGFILNNYAKGIKKSYSNPLLVPETLSTEICIACTNDTVIFPNTLKHWVSEMKQLGRNIDLKMLNSGHLNSHLKEPESYLEIFTDCFTPNKNIPTTTSL